MFTEEFHGCVFLFFLKQLFSDQVYQNLKSRRSRRQFCVAAFLCPSGKTEFPALIAQQPRNRVCWKLSLLDEYFQLFALQTHIFLDVVVSCRKSRIAFLYFVACVSL